MGVLAVKRARRSDPVIPGAHSGFVFERIIVPWRLRPEFADKERQEALVTASDLDWTRPADWSSGSSGIICTTYGSQTCRRSRSRAGS
jgi:hypothetical protein